MSWNKPVKSGQRPPMGIGMFLEHATKRTDAQPVMLGINKGMWQIATDSVTAYAVRYCMDWGLRFAVDFGLDNAVRIATGLALLRYEQMT